MEEVCCLLALAFYLHFAKKIVTANLRRPIIALKFFFASLKLYKYKSYLSNPESIISGIHHETSIKDIWNQNQSELFISKSWKVSHVQLVTIYSCVCKLFFYLTTLWEDRLSLLYPMEKKWMSLLAEFDLSLLKSYLLRLSPLLRNASQVQGGRKVRYLF